MHAFLSAIIPISMLIVVARATWGLTNPEDERLGWTIPLFGLVMVLGLIAHDFY